MAKIPLVGFQALPGVVRMALAKIALTQIFATASDFDIAQKFAAKLAMALSLAAKLKPFQMSSCFQLLPAASSCFQLLPAASSCFQLAYFQE